MLIKTNELQGVALDWAVAKCEGATEEWRDNGPFLWDGAPCIRLGGRDVDYQPSKDWATAGPIIERERIHIRPNQSDQDFKAFVIIRPHGLAHRQNGSTLLIAAMRCFVASKLGDEIDVPEELQ